MRLDLGRGAGNRDTALVERRSPQPNPLAVGVRLGHELQRVRQGDDERRFGAQYAVDLTEHARDIGHLREGVHRETEVDLVGADEREVGEVAVVELDANVLGLGVVPGDRQAGRRRVDHDDTGALPGERDRVAAVAATELEDAPAVAAPDQPVDRVVGQAGTEANRAGGERCTGRIAEGRHRWRGIRR